MLLRDTRASAWRRMKIDELSSRTTAPQSSTTHAPKSSRADTWPSSLASRRVSLSVRRQYWRRARMSSPLSGPVNDLRLEGSCEEEDDAEEEDEESDVEDVVDVVVLHDQIAGHARFEGGEEGFEDAAQPEQEIGDEVGEGGQLEIVEDGEKIGDEEGDAQRGDVDPKSGQSDGEVRVKEQHIEENSHDGADEGLEDDPEVVATPCRIRRTSHPPHEGMTPTARGSIGLLTRVLCLLDDGPRAQDGPHCPSFRPSRVAETAHEDEDDSDQAKRLEEDEDREEGRQVSEDGQDCHKYEEAKEEWGGEVDGTRATIGWTLDTAGCRDG